MEVKTIEQALKTLRNGGVVAHATDTCYGFAGDVFNKEAIKKVYGIKKMSADKPVSILVGDLTMAKKYGHFNKHALELAKKYWPSALTIVVRRKKTLPKFLNSKSKTIGIRIPRHVLSLSLAKKLGRPISTTSANITTLPPPYSVSAIKKQFKNEKYGPDFIIDSGRLPKKSPSTIVDASSKNLKIIRQGDLIIT